MKMKKVMETRLMRSLFHRWWNENYRRQNIIMSPDYYAQLHSLLRIGQIKDVSLVRVGDTGQRSGDGAYIMADDFLSGGVFAPTRRDKSPVWALCGLVGYVCSTVSFARYVVKQSVFHKMKEQQSFLTAALKILLCYNFADWIGDVIFRQIHLQCRSI